MLFAYLNGFLHNMNGNSTFEGSNNPGGDNTVIILAFFFNSFSNFFTIWSISFILLKKNISRRKICKPENISKYIFRYIYFLSRNYFSGKCGMKFFNLQLDY